MDESVKNALRAFARFTATEKMPTPQELEGLKGFRIIEADDPVENELTLRKFLFEDGLTIEQVKWFHFLLGQAETAVTEGCTQVIGRIRRIVEDEKKRVIDGHEALVIATFLFFAFGVVASPAEPIEPRPMKYAATAKPAFNLGTVTAGAPAVKQVKKAQPPASAAKTGTATTEPSPQPAPTAKGAAAATAAPASANAAPQASATPAPAVGNRVEELEAALAKEKADHAETRKEMARHIEKVGRLINYCEGVGERPAFLNRRVPPPSPPHEASPVHADSHPLAQQTARVPPHTPPADPNEIRKWEKLLEHLLETMRSIPGVGKERNEKVAKLRDDQETFRRRGGAAYGRAIEAIDAFLRGEFRDMAAFKAKFQELT